MRNQMITTEPHTMEWTLPQGAVEEQSVNTCSHLPLSPMKINKLR